ncbi:LOW QUALITY PROTEIN: cilia- and flagella-associated protein 91-like [Physella acuta]|uniref:LOW QUALITY PROTEIN: cilia- and flagella-associated protein 91-like n=1 Tax=Physella acuta TaxID=109671 RepID=UPI0027DC0326|nr:LOW QUALITY PROTEIN: cilia- and flagella-associated protein 91-like [Physella acuta]
MASTTQTIRRQLPNPSRTYDFLYDNNYILSSAHDHGRVTFQAHTSTNRIKQVPVFKTMFSELRHHPRFQVHLDVTDPVPKFITREWKGHGDSMIRYATFKNDSSIKVSGQEMDSADVTGRNRFLYLKRPIIPFLQQVPPEVLLSTARQDPLSGPENVIAKRLQTPATKTIETQTDYRDQEIQTDPYTPEYVVRPGEAPELLTLATLSFGRGLPAGLAEVEMIERARAKRAWEANLPPLSDTASLEKRRKMMDEMERKEWALREHEIEKLQEARLEVLKQLLKQREDNHQELNIKRLDKLWAVKQKSKEAKIKKIRNEHIKALRKLTEKRLRVETSFCRSAIIQEYADPGSQTYAPLTRIGVFLDHGSEQYLVKSRHLSTYQGLLELEASLPDFVMNPRVKAPRPVTVTKTGFIKRKFKKEKELAEAYEAIKAEEEKNQDIPRALRFLQRIERPIPRIPRPPTPEIEILDDEEENKQLAVIFLQQVFRGRAIQNNMLEGKAKRRELINEIRSTHALQEKEQNMKKHEEKETLALQKQRRLHEHKESLIDESLAELESKSLGEMFDFLTKELVRLQEERRIHAFSMLAERQRRIREAEESGRRQWEIRRRREEDEIFKQVVKTHQVTVDSYLENIITGSIDRTANEQARLEIEEQAAVINDLAYQVEDSRDKLESEEIVADLVHCFLIPEAKKQTVREKVRRTQRRFLLAAHNEVHKEGTDLIAIHNKQKQLENEALQGVPQVTVESGVEQDKLPDMASE